LPNLSPNDLHPDLSAELSLDESSLDENNLSGNDALDSSSQDKPPQDAAIKNQGSSPKITEKSEPLEDYPKSSQAKPSLPVFEEVALPTQIDMESLTISELFIKREQYSQVLETLYTAQKELDALIKKSAVAKPNEKIGILLKKATTKHAELNKDLMFVEEHLIE
jgi:hypothetical protein